MNDQAEVPELARHPLYGVLLSPSEADLDELAHAGFRVTPDCRALYHPDHWERAEPPDGELHSLRPRTPQAVEWSMWELARGVIRDKEQAALAPLMGYSDPNAAAPRRVTRLLTRSSVHDLPADIDLRRALVELAPALANGVPAPFVEFVKRAFRAEFERGAFVGAGARDGVGIIEYRTEVYPRVLSALGFSRSGIEMDGGTAHAVFVTTSAEGPSGFVRYQARLVNGILREAEVRKRLAHAGSAVEALRIIAAEDQRIPEGKLG